MRNGRGGAGRARPPFHPALRGRARRDHVRDQPRAAAHGGCELAQSHVRGRGGECFFLRCLRFPLRKNHDRTPAGVAQPGPAALQGRPHGRRVVRGGVGAGDPADRHPRAHIHPVADLPPLRRRVLGRARGLRGRDVRARRPRDHAGREDVRAVAASPEPGCARAPRACVGRHRPAHPATARGNARVPEPGRHRPRERLARNPRGRRDVRVRARRRGPRYRDRGRGRHARGRRARVGLRARQRRGGWHRPQFHRPRRRALGGQRAPRPRRAEDQPVCGRRRPRRPLDRAADVPGAGIARAGHVRAPRRGEWRRGHRLRTCIPPPRVRLP